MGTRNPLLPYLVICLGELAQLAIPEFGSAIIQLVSVNKGPPPLLPVILRRGSKQVREH